VKAMSDPGWHSEIIEGTSRRDTNDIERQKSAQDLGG
jgi:hypothetical protein